MLRILPFIHPNALFCRKDETLTIENIFVIHAGTKCEGYWSPEEDVRV
jgi:hypothetical protein